MKFVFGLTIIAILGMGIAKVKDSQSKKFIEQIEQPIYVKAIYSMPVSYDPIKMNDGASLIFSELVYEGLLRFTDDYGVQAGIAESWSTSPDGLTLTFKLNPNAKFHNGKAVTADDVKASLTRNVSKESVVFKFYDVIKGSKDYHLVEVARGLEVENSKKQRRTACNNKTLETPIKTGSLATTDLLSIVSYICLKRAIFFWSATNLPQLTLTK